MELTPMGGSGLLVSRIAFGTMLISKSGKGPWRMPAVKDEAESHAMLDKYVAMGGNYIDTSNNYGESEEVIGNWLAKKPANFRRKIILGTKVMSPVGPGPNDTGASRKHIMDAVDDSLRKLQTTYIDLYTVHYWDERTPISETFGTLNDLVRMGKIRYIGISNFTPVQIVRTMNLCRDRKWERPISTQCQYNLLCRVPEWEMIKLCEEEGVGFWAWSPLSGGWLSGKYRDPSALKRAPTDSRMGFAEAVKFKPWDLSTQGQNPQTWRTIEECAAIGEELGVPISQVAVRWILQMPGCTGVVIGPRSLANLEDSMNCMKFTLSEDQMERLNRATVCPPLYPYCGFAELSGGESGGGTKQTGGAAKANASASTPAKSSSSSSTATPPRPKRRHRKR